MPITGHEKQLRVHSRSSTDLLAAVPIKKRRFLFPRSPSPPPRSPSPICAECGIREKKSESSVLVPPSSETGGDSAQENIVTGKVTSHESCGLQSQTPADCGISEKKPESSGSGSLFSKSGGNLAQVDVVTGRVASRESPSPAPADHCMPEKKPEFSKCASHGISGSNCAHVNAMKAENAFSEPCKSQPALINCVEPEKKLESRKPGSPVSKTGGTSAEENTLTGKNTPSKPRELPSPIPTDCSISERKPESSESPFSVISRNPAEMNSVTGKDASSESCEVLKTGNLNIVSKHEILPTSIDQGSGLNFAANAHDGTGNGQQMVVDNKLATLPVTGSMVTTSAAKPTFEMLGRVGRVEGKFTVRQGISVKQEEPEQQNVINKSGDTKINADFGNLCLNRSNWDLNMSMDAWEGSSTRSSLNNGTADHGRQDLEGKHNKGLELGLKQSLLKDALLGNHGLQKYDQHLKFSNPNPITSMVGSNSEASLQFHLTPSSLSNPSRTSGTHGAIKEKPFLSLAMKPISSTTVTPLAVCRTIKSEPTEGVQKDTGKVHLGILKSLDMKPVKTEPSEGQQISKTAISGNLNLAGSRAVKPESSDDQSQGYARRTKGSSFHMGQKSLLPQITQLHQNVGKDNNKALELASKPLVLNGLLHTRTKRPDINIPNVSSDMVDKTGDLVSPPLILGNEMSISTAITQGSDGIVTEPSSSVPNSVISDRNDLNSHLGPRATSSLPLTLLPESLTSNGKGHALVQDAPNCDVKLDHLNDQHPFNVTLTDEVLTNPCGTGNVAESDEVEGKVEVSSEVPEEHCDNTCKSCSSPATDGAINPVHKLGGKSDEDFEDGEVRDPALNGAVGGSCGITEEQPVNAANTINPVDLPVSMPVVGDEQEIEAESSKDMNVLGCKESGGGLLEGKVEPGLSAVGAPATDSGEKNLSKTIRKNPKDQPKNNKGVEKKIKSSGLGTKTNLPGSQSGASGTKQQNEGSKLAKNYVSRKTEHSDKDGVRKDANDRGNHKQIIYLNSASNCVAPGKRKLTLDRSMSARGERERPVDRSFRGERSHSRGSRDESSNERSRKVESERHYVYGHPGEKCRPDLIRIRGRADRLAALHGDRNSNAEHLIDEINCSNGLRYSRAISAGEVAIGASLEGSNRLGRKLTNEEIQNISRLPCQRQSPGGRVQIPLGRHLIGRDVPEFVLLAHEEKSLRNLPEDMVEQSMLSHPRSQYERGEDILIHRERRSLSPMLRRGGPLRLPPNGLKFFPRSQQRTARQWSPSRRPQDGFSGPRELVRSRSPPPIMRLNRMQSPLEHPCFPEEIMLRRRGSPHYISRLPNDMVDAAPSREHDFPPRLVRGSNRNMRRFNVIDPAEEEFIPRGQIREFGVGDEFVEDRRFDERRGPVRSFRQRCNAGDNVNENFRFHVEDGPPRALRLRHGANEGFLEGNGHRDFDVRFRNRLGNSSGRLRGIVEEQEENYRHHAEQEWCETAFSDARPKRRRF